MCYPTYVITLLIGILASTYYVTTMFVYIWISYLLNKVSDIDVLISIAYVSVFYIVFVVGAYCVSEWEINKYKKEMLGNGSFS